MNIFYFLGGIVLLVPAVVFSAFAILRNQKNKQRIRVGERKPESGTETAAGEEKVEEGKKWYAFLTTQQWVDMENALLFLGNVVFLAAYYFLLPGIIQEFFLPSWHISAVRILMAACVLPAIGVIYYLYSSEKPTQRVKAYTILNTVGVILCILFSLQSPTFFTTSGVPLAKVNKDGVVSEVFFTDANFSPVSKAALRDIQPDDVEQAKKLMVTGSDVVRLLDRVPIIGWLIPDQPSPPRPTLEERGYQQVTIAGSPSSGSVCIISVRFPGVFFWGDGRYDLGQEVSVGDSSKKLDSRLKLWVHKDNLAKIGGVRRDGMVVGIRCVSVD